jgi:ribosomal protein S18 acetylase RimI-like enzyme
VIELRPAVEADIPQLESLLRRSWLSTWAAELTLETVQRWAREDLAGTYARTRWRDFIVADKDGRVHGMCHVGGNFLHAIHLDHRSKRRGIGTLLMAEAERRIAADGHAEATLETDSFNKAAIAFYEQRGWRVRRIFMGTETGEPIESVAMYKPLK